MIPETLFDNLARFSAQFSPEELNRASFSQALEALLPVLAAAESSTLSHSRFSFERVDFSDRARISPGRLDQLRRLAIEAGTPAEPAYRVFRREVPLAQSLIAGSQPTWSAGAAPERSFGPFLSSDGRRFWFDLFPIIRLIPLYLAGQPNPALLFYLPQLQQGHGALPPISEILPILHRPRVNLAGSSIWVRADLLADGSPAGHYAGFRINTGELSFSKKPQDIGGKLTLPADSVCSVSLKLSHDAAPPGGPPSEAGRDARNANLNLPDNLDFRFSLQAHSVTAAGRGRWKVYGQDTTFQWNAQGTPFYEPSLRCALIPYNANQEEFSVQSSASPFATVAGTAAIVQSAWAIPLAAIDVNQPTPPGGNGGMAVQTSEGLEITWRGLRNGPIYLPQPWIVLFPGLLTIVDPKAGNLHARQRFLLWKDADAPFRSSVELQYTDSFPLYYVTNAQGAEALMANADAEARLDRPVDVAGSALDIRSKNSLLILGFTDELQLVYLYDDNILIDNLDLQQTPAPQLPPPIALAIRNALFTATPVNGFLLFAELLDEEMVDTGHVLLVMGLYGLLPTLPDPYAANVGVFRRRGGRGSAVSVPIMLLLCHIPWKKAPDDEPDTVVVNFHFAPLSPSAYAFLQAGATTPATTGTPAQPQSSAFNPDSPRRKWEDEWDRRFQRFYQEQFALLDVSTNADWMGVSFAWFNPRTVNDRDYVFYQVYGAQQTGDQTQSLFPLQVQGLDLISEGRFVRAFTTPQISWEPYFNLTPPQVTGDPPPFFNFFPNDGGPTRLFNDNKESVPVAPLPKIDELLHYFHDTAGGFTGALFTLPFGMKAFAEFNKNHAYLPDAKLELNQSEFREGTLKGGLQIRADAPQRVTESAMFIGGTLQLNNLVFPNGTPTGAGILGNSVSEIFNNEFFVLTNGYGDRGVPLERIDFSGYGAGIFSRWENPEAAFAETSQARFDVFKGRTAHEVIQVKSVVYPWGIRVVRTIVVFRVGSGYVYRYDTGWQAETPGLYDFSYRVKETPVSQPVKRDNPFEIHPGIVKGVYNVRNITETPDIPIFERVWNKVNGDTYIDDAGVEQTVDNATPNEFKNPPVKLQPVYFDADVEIEFIKAGAVNGRVPSKGMLGYVQLGPKGQPIPDFLFRDLLREQFGSLGGPVDCQIDIGDTGQQMRLSRVDVSESVNAAGSKPVFAGTARGSAVLPKDGAWSVVRYQHSNGEVSPLPDAATVPLIRKGLLGAAPSPADPLRLENPMELVRAPQADSIFFGLLQTTGTQKALFRKPRFKKGVQELLSETPDFADAYRMLNSAGIFPNLQDGIPLDLGSFKTKIIEEGFKLLDEADPTKILEKALPDGPWYIIDEEFLKIYIEYDKRDKDGNKTSDGSVNFGIDSAAADMGKRWLSKMNNIGMVVDLGPLPRLLMVKGKFDAEKGAAPSFVGPELEFSDALQPVIDILQILLMLQGGDYASAFSKGLEVAMSNTAGSWSYAFHARKEIPVVKFPPGPAYDNPTNPLKLEAGLSVGVYFNEVFSMTGNPQQLIPSAGAYLGFYGRLSVMCVSVAAATVYATGSVDLAIGADIKTGPSLMMKFGFGAEINAGIPVVGTVSLLFMVGVEITLDSTKMVIAGFLYFRGRAEILGGIVTVTIYIEAKGIVERLSGSDTTNMIAQVTFGLDISIFLVINISFSKSWQESRQIA